MTSALTWLLVGLAVLAWPSRNRRPPRRHGADSAGRAAGAIPATALRGAAVASTVLTSVGLFGVVPGLALAVVVAPVAAATTSWLAARPRARGPAPRLPLALDLAAAALRAGRPVDQALVLAAPAVPGPVGDLLGQVAGLLRLGADPAEAWRAVASDAVLAPVARTATRSAGSGARLAAALEDSAAELRDQACAAARARAQRAGTWAMAPLGLCFLPAFVCLGVVPVVVGIARGALAALP